MQKFATLGINQYIFMHNIDTYINAATRENTRSSYRSAIEHYEVEWGGFLPATADSVARYLADHASQLAISTLRQRLAALARWHIDQGFPDPTKSPMVKKVMKGIQFVHPQQTTQAKPLVLSQLEHVDEWLGSEIEQALFHNDTKALLKARRDRAILLLGFWRGFRSDELSRLCAEHIVLNPGEGMSLFLPHTKTLSQGVTYKAPALKRLCPATAYEEWRETAALSQGPAFQGINRWGHLSGRALHPASYITLLRELFKAADIADAERYSSHSLRRGFATWASTSGWDMKTLMEYVGWKDMRSAMRYIEGADPFARQRINNELEQSAKLIGSPQ